MFMWFVIHNDTRNKRDGQMMELRIVFRESTYRSLMAIVDSRMATPPFAIYLRLYLFVTFYGAPESMPKFLHHEHRMSRPEMRTS